MKVVLSQINFIGVLRRMSVTYVATLSVREETVLFVSSRLHAERQRRGTRAGTRALGCFKQAILVIRWFLDGTRVAQLAVDNAIGRSTAYDYLHEGVDALAPAAPSLHAALLAAKMAGYDHVNIDGTLIETDRCRTPGPTPGVDLWWSGKHNNHGGNIQVITAPDGWPLWTSDVRPGREHDIRCHDRLGDWLRACYCSATGVIPRICRLRVQIGPTLNRWPAHVARAAIDGRSRSVRIQHLGPPLGSPPCLAAFQGNAGRPAVQEQVPRFSSITHVLGGDSPRSFITTYAELPSGRRGWHRARERVGWRALHYRSRAWRC